jgi:hypothetical protein
MIRKLIQIIILIFLLNFLFSCSSKDLSTDTSSADFNNKEDKLEFLHKYIKPIAGLTDAEYYIKYIERKDKGLNKDESADWDIIVALKIQHDSLKKFVDHGKRVSYLISDSIWTTLNISDEKWNRTSQANLFVDGRNIQMVFSKDGIILARYSTLSPQITKEKSALRFKDFINVDEIGKIKMWNIKGEHFLDELQLNSFKNKLENIVLTNIQSKMGSIAFNLTYKNQEIQVYSTNYGKYIQVYAQELNKYPWARNSFGELFFENEEINFNNF